MTIALTTPITGATQTGLTAPTYTIAVDTAPAVNMKQWVVTALGGTQAGVAVHAIGNPFTISCWKPVIYKFLSALGASGVLKNVPRNVHKVTTRKGLLPLAGQSIVVGMVQTTIDLPAGADLADPSSIRAMLSAHFGALTQASAGIGDTTVSGVL